MRILTFEYRFCGNKVFNSNFYKKGLNFFTVEKNRNLQINTCIGFTRLQFLYIIFFENGSVTIFQCISFLLNVLARNSRWAPHCKRNFLNNLILLPLFIEVNNRKCSHWRRGDYTDITCFISVENIFVYNIHV